MVYTFHGDGAYDDNLSPRNRYNSLAKKRANEFLRSWLTDGEYEQLVTSGLRIKSKIDPNTVYIVHKNASKMVHLEIDGKVNDYLCIVSQDFGYENDDTVLAKILLIKANEREFLRIAEVHNAHLPDVTMGYEMGFRLRSRHNTNSRFS